MVETKINTPFLLQKNIEEARTISKVVHPTIEQTKKKKNTNKNSVRFLFIFSM